MSTTVRSEQPLRGRNPARIVAGLLVAIGTGMIFYAISDHPFYGGEPGFGRVQLLIAIAGSSIAACALAPMGIAQRVLLLTATNLIMLALAEVAGEVVLGPVLRPIYQSDERLIFKFVPGRKSTMMLGPANGSEKVTHHINSAGFRGPELRPLGEVPRVMVYGDSFIHASYSQEDETFVAQLAARLSNRLGTQVEAINAGVSSYGPDQVALKMEDELPRLQPDVVVVAIFAGNDYGDLMRNKMFRINRDGSLIQNRWMLDPELLVRFRLNQEGSILVRGIRSALAFWHSAATRRGQSIDMDSFLAEAQREYREFVVARDDVVRNTHVDYYNADVSLTPRAESARYKIALMRAVLGRIHDVARRNNAPLALLLIPHPLDVAGRTEWGEIDRDRYPGYSGRNATDILEDMVRSLGVPYVNLYDEFLALDADTLYLRGGDDHWNAAGQKKAAEVMAACILANGMSANFDRTLPVECPLGSAVQSPQ